MSVSAVEFEVIIEKVNAFFEEELLSIEEKAIGKQWNEVLPLLKNARDKVKAKGLWTPQIPKEYGGLGLSLAQFGKVSEILGRSPYGHFVFNCQAPDAGNMEILIEHGSAEQKDKFLKPLLAGEIRSCFSMTEPGYAGSNPVMMGTTAIKDGDDYK